MNDIENTSIQANVARELTDLYNDVGAKLSSTIQAAVKFGAKLIEWEQYLGVSVGGRGASGEGVKGWLAENCPGINYQTAMGYKHLAEKNLKMLEAVTPKQLALASLVGKDKVENPDGEYIDVPAEAIERRDEIFTEATSRRKFEQMFFDFCGGASGKGPGRPKGPKLKGQAMGAVTPMDEARELFARMAVSATQPKLVPSMKLWDADMLKATVDSLTPVLEMAKKLLGESR